MKTKIILITIMSIILLGAVLFLTFNISDESITGYATLNEYSYTKAVCNGTYCQDYEIICRGSEIISKTPITGAVVKQPADWKDPRDQAVINEFCLRE